MSKVYKSSHVSMGTPKSIVNTFKSEERQAAADGDNTAAQANSLDSENTANSIIEDAKQMYLKIIEEANSEAQRLTEAAEAEAERLMQAAGENGYREGYEAGYLEGRREAQSIIDNAAELREYLDSRNESFYEEAEEQLLKLVMEVSKKVIGSELTQNNEAILSLVNMALQKCAFKKKLVLKVSPQDYDFVKESKNRICMMVEGISDIEIISDLSLPQGSCIIETPSGEINSSIDVQITEIEKIFNYLYMTK